MVDTALAYSQFETVHQFLDGYVRVGRLLIILLGWLGVDPAGRLTYW